MEIQALKQSQLLNVKLLNKVRQASEEIATLKANQRSCSAQGQVPALLHPHKEDIKRRAKCFAVMNELFLNASIFEKQNHQL